jgi:hypothetical protein
VAAPAWIGWYDHVVPPQLTTCCTQAGELAAEGSMTWDGRPTAMLGWACRIPSSSHSNPKPIRSTWRPAGSGTAARPLPPAAPAACGRRTATQAMDSTAKTARMIRPWCSSAARNAATTVGSSTFRPLFIPGMAPVTSRPRVRTTRHDPVMST